MATKVCRVVIHTRMREKTMCTYSSVVECLGCIHIGAGVVMEPGS